MISPPAIDIPVTGDVEEAVEVDLTDLFDDPTELCTLLEGEQLGKSFWLVIALSYAKQRKLDHAIKLVERGLGVASRHRPEDRLSLLTCLVWLHLNKAREAPRMGAGE